MFSAVTPTGPAGQAAAVGTPRAPLTSVETLLEGVVDVPLVVVGVVVVPDDPVLVEVELSAVAARASPQALGAR